MSRFSRRAPGERFSEGSRLLWTVKEERGLSMHGLAALLVAETASVSRWLYGDQIPRAEMLVRIERLFPAIAVAAWFQKPRGRFVVPGARKAA